MTPSLEQELEAIIVGSDYRVRLSVSSFLHVHVIYAPARRASADGRWLIADGEIGCKLFAGPPRWRWWRARRFVRGTVEGHRRLLAEGIGYAR